MSTRKQKTLKRKALSEALKFEIETSDVLRQEIRSLYILSKRILALPEMYSYRDMSPCSAPAAHPVALLKNLHLIYASEFDSKK